ncbi:3-phosphoshikimate 1-carboxyvinyltransferase [Beggiatoa alba]|nr:3-phosphoshikimate 1-carboxyvinyltransferase [Beggiatoa alba]
MTHSKRFIVQAGGQLRGEHRVPGDKSISHRSIMLGALAEGTTHVSGFLEGEDTLATLAAFQAMGVKITRPSLEAVTIEGVGLHGLKAPAQALYLGNSGTSMRLMSGILAGQSFSVEMTGDPSLSRRPMKRVTVPLAQMGAKIDTAENGTPPLKIHAGQGLQGIDYTMPIASAQVKSCLLLAGLYAKGMTCITEPAPTRDHTERMLRGFGYPIQQAGDKVCLQGGGRLQATDIEVPADISSAAFFMVGASIAAGSDIILKHVGINPTRIGVLNILRLMGAKITLLNEREIGGEPVADIRVQASPLKGIRIPVDQVPLAIDEFPAIFIAAACAEGETILTDAEELRVKESDRIQVMADGLLKLGISAQPTPDGIVIKGGQLQGGIIDSHGDHRIAMSFTIAGLRANGTIEIEDCANVATSFPTFIQLAQTAGIQVQEQEA